MATAIAEFDARWCADRIAAPTFALLRTLLIHVT